MKKIRHSKLPIWLESADELTPDMLMPYKAYKKDGGLVKKSILYTPIVSIDKLLSPIGASRW